MPDTLPPSAPQPAPQPQSETNAGTPKVLPTLQSLIPALIVRKKTNAQAEASPPPAEPMPTSEVHKPLFLSLSDVANEAEKAKEEKKRATAETAVAEEQLTEGAKQKSPLRKRTRYKIVKRYVWRRKKKGTKWVKVKRLQKLRVKVKSRTARKAVHQLTITKKTAQQKTSSSSSGSATATAAPPAAPSVTTPASTGATASGGGTHVLYVLPQRKQSGQGAGGAAGKTVPNSGGKKGSAAAPPIDEIAKPTTPNSATVIQAPISADDKEKSLFWSILTSPIVSRWGKEKKDEPQDEQPKGTASGATGTAGGAGVGGGAPAVSGPSADVPEEVIKALEDAAGAANTKKKSLSFLKKFIAIDDDDEKEAVPQGAVASIPDGLGDIVVQATPTGARRSGTASDLKAELAELKDEKEREQALSDTLETALSPQKKTEAGTAETTSNGPTAKVNGRLAQRAFGGSASPANNAGIAGSPAPQTTSSSSQGKGGAAAGLALSGLTAGSSGVSGPHKGGAKKTAPVGGALGELQSAASAKQSIVGSHPVSQQASAAAQAPAAPVLKKGKKGKKEELTGALGEILNGKIGVTKKTEDTTSATVGTALPQSAARDGVSESVRTPMGESGGSSVAGASLQGIAGQSQSAKKRSAATTSKQPSPFAFIDQKKAAVPTAPSSAQAVSPVTPVSGTSTVVGVSSTGVTSGQSVAPTGDSKQVSTVSGLGSSGAVVPQSSPSSVTQGAQALATGTSPHAATASQGTPTEGAQIVSPTVPALGETTKKAAGVWQGIIGTAQQADAQKSTVTGTPVSSGGTSVDATSTKPQTPAPTAPKGLGGMMARALPFGIGAMFAPSEPMLPQSLSQIDAVQKKGKGSKKKGADAIEQTAQSTQVLGAKSDAIAAPASAQQKQKKSAGVPSTQTAAQAWGFLTQPAPSVSVPVPVLPTMGPSSSAPVVPRTSTGPEAKSVSKPQGIAAGAPTVTLGAALPTSASEAPADAKKAGGLGEFVGKSLTSKGVTPVAASASTPTSTPSSGSLIDALAQKSSKDLAAAKMASGSIAPATGSAGAPASADASVVTPIARSVPTSLVDQRLQDEKEVKVAKSEVSTEGGWMNRVMSKDAMGRMNAAWAFLNTPIGQLSQADIESDSFLKRANVKKAESKFGAAADGPVGMLGKREDKKGSPLADVDISKDSFLSKVVNPKLSAKESKSFLASMPLLTSMFGRQAEGGAAVSVPKAEELSDAVKRVRPQGAGPIGVIGGAPAVAPETLTPEEKAEQKRLLEEMRKEAEEKRKIKEEELKKEREALRIAQEKAAKEVPHVSSAIKRKEKSGFRQFLAALNHIGLGRERLQFTSNLATMLNAGLPLIDALQTLGKETRVKPMKVIINRIVETVENGSPLWRAMDNEDFFSSHAIALIRIGEEAGSLAANMEYLSAQESKDSELQGKVKMAMIYPSIVMTIMFIVVMGLGIFVLPKLIGVLTSLNVPLPLVTRLVIGFSNFMSANGLVIVPGSLVGFFFIVVIAKFTPLKVVVQWITFKIPGIGELARDSTIARFGVILGGLLRAGVPVVEAVQSLVNVTSIMSYRHFYERLLDHITVGDSFAKSFALIRNSEKLLPVSVQQLVITGEKSGALSQIMLKVADIYDKKATETAERLPVILEPMILLFIGALVGTIAFAIIVPIYSIVGSVGR